jgi:Fur family peroxide stress response transcriptional regulator
MSPSRRSGSLPANYQLVYDVLREAGPGVHLTTNDAYARARVRRPAIGISTVYRGIQRLRDMGLVDEILVPGAAAAVYEPVASPHAHFRCDRCGRVDDVAYNVPRRTIDALAKHMEAYITDSVVTLRGECRECRATSG